MSAVVVRAATGPDEWSAMAALRRAWDEEDAGGPIDDPGFEARAVAWIEANRTHRLGWVAYVDDEPVGLLTAVTLERMPQPGRPDSGWGYVHHVFVRPGHRDRGVGAALMDAAVAEADRRGWSQLVLHPRPRSIPFYERAGFVRSETLFYRPLDAPR